MWGADGFCDDMKRLEKVAADQLIPSKQLALLEDGLKDEESPATPFVRKALDMVPHLRQFIRQANERLAELGENKEYDVDLITKDAPEVDRLLMGTYICGHWILWTIPRCLQEQFNDGMEQAYAHKWTEVKIKIALLRDRARRFYKRLILKAVEFEPFVQFFCDEAHVQSPKQLGLMNSRAIQWMFHELFHGGFVVLDVGEMGNWMNVQTRSRGSAGRLYCICECGCWAAADRFLNDMARGGWSSVLAMSQRYNEHIMSQEYDVKPLF